jgi:hypothetical protein
LCNFAIADFLLKSIVAVVDIYPETETREPLPYFRSILFLDNETLASAIPSTDHNLKRLTKGAATGITTTWRGLSQKGLKR